MPHQPIAVSDKFKGRSELGLYGDVIMEIDWSVGQILESLKLNQIDDNTLVIFTSDNGPWLNFGDWGGSAGPLREGKGTMWEGGARVPCIMRWPNRIPPNTVTSNIASTIDILPTIAEIIGEKKLSSKIDGVSLLSLLENKLNEHNLQIESKRFMTNIKNNLNLSQNTKVNLDKLFIKIWNEDDITLISNMLNLASNNKSEEINYLKSIESILDSKEKITNQIIKDTSNLL